MEIAKVVSDALLDTLVEVTNVFRKLKAAKTATAPGGSYFSAHLMRHLLHQHRQYHVKCRMLPFESSPGESVSCSVTRKTPQRVSCARMKALSFF